MSTSALTTAVAALNQTPTQGQSGHVQEHADLTAAHRATLALLGSGAEGADPDVTARLARMEETDRFVGHRFDGVRATASMTAGSFVVTGHVFTGADVGKPILVEGAGAAGADLVTSIASVSSGVATLQQAAGTDASATTVTYGTDQTEAINEALAWAAANRRELRLPGGIAILVAGGLVASATMTISGEGCGDAYGSGVTELCQFSKTAQALTISGLGVTVKDLYVNCQRSDTLNGTTSGAIHFNGGASHLARVNVQNFGTGFSYDAINYATMDACRSMDCRVYGARLKNTQNADYGDMRITNSFFIGQRFNRINGSAVRWESGGGLYFTNCKINGAQQSGNTQAWTHGIECAIADNAYTQQIYVAHCSIEGINGGHGITISRQNTASPGALFRVNISDNEIHVDGPGTAVNLDGGTAGYLYDVKVHDNDLAGSYGVVVRTCDRAFVNDNNITASAAPVAFAGDCRVYGARGNRIPATYRELFLDLVGESSNASEQRRKDALEFTNPLPPIVSGGSTDLWKVVPKPTWKPIIAEVQVCGNVPTVGGTTWSGRFALNPTDDGEAFTVTALGAPVTSGASISIVAYVADNNRFKVRVDMPPGKTMYGESCIRLLGPVQGVEQDGD